MGTMEQTASPSTVQREQLLIERAQAGDRRAFEELIFKFDRQVLRLTLHMLGNRDDARDAYQETFMKAFRSIERFRGQSSFYTWILRIATNVCLDRLKNRRHSRQELSIDGPTHGDTGNGFKQTLRATSCYDNPEQLLYAAQVGRSIRRAFRTLSKREQLVFELKHQQGLKLKQIGEIVGSSEDGVKNCLCRAVHKLRVQLAPLFLGGQSA